MKKLEVFLSDFIGFIPNTISESVAQGDVIVPLFITLLIIVVAVLSVEGLSSAALYGFRSANLRLRESIYLASCVRVTWATVITFVMILLLMYWLYTMSDALKNLSIATIYGSFTPVIYGALKCIYLKRKYTKECEETD